MTLTKSDQRKIDKLYNFDDESTVSQTCCSSKWVELKNTGHYSSYHGVYEQQSYGSMPNSRYIYKHANGGELRLVFGNNFERI